MYKKFSVKAALARKSSNKTKFNYALLTARFPAAYTRKSKRAIAVSKTRPLYALLKGHTAIY